jgi:hypothetical protein
LTKVNKNFQKHQAGKRYEGKNINLEKGWVKSTETPTQLILSSPIYLGSPVTFLF